MVLGALKDAHWDKSLDPGGPRQVWQDEVLLCLNDRRVALGLKSMHPRRLGQILSGLGFRDRVERIKVRAEHGKRRIIETPLVKALLSPPSLSREELGALGPLGASGQASLDSAPVPSAPSAPSGEIRGENRTTPLRGDLFDRALARFREDPRKEEARVEQDLILAYRIPEERRSAVEEIVHHAYLRYRRERTPQATDGIVRPPEAVPLSVPSAPLEERKGGEREAQTGSGADTSKEISLQDLEQGEPPPEISRKWDRLLQIFDPELVKWAIGRSLEMRVRGDPWTADRLRSEGSSEFRDLPNEVETLADAYFSDLDAIASSLHERRKAGSSSSCTTSTSSASRGQILD